MAALTYVLVAACVLAVVSAQGAEGPKIDYQVLLKNQPYVESQLACISKTDATKCDRIGTRLRDVLLPDVAKTGACNVCNPQEKIFLAHAAKLLIREYNAQWKALFDIYKVAADIRPKILAAELAAIEKEAAI